MPLFSLFFPSTPPPLSCRSSGLIVWTACFTQSSSSGFPSRPSSTVSTHTHAPLTLHLVLFFEVSGCHIERLVCSRFSLIASYWPPWISEDHSLIYIHVHTHSLLFSISTYSFIAIVHAKVKIVVIYHGVPILYDFLPLNTKAVVQKNILFTFLIYCNKSEWGLWLSSCKRYTVAP